MNRITWGSLGRLCVSSGDARRDLARILLPAGLLYGALAILFASGLADAIVDTLLGTGFPAHPDLPFYQERTDRVLQGQIPYLDFDTESPPLIIYLMVPAALMGNSLLAYALLFSGYVLGSVAVTYLLLRRIDADLACRAAALLAFNPVMVISATLYVQDECVVILFYLIPVLLMAVGERGQAVATAVVGAFVKVLSGLLVPLALIDDRDWRRHALMLGIIALAISLPFLILAPETFIRFPLYYLSQTGSAGMDEGINLWRFLNDAGLAPPGWLLQSLWIGGSAGVLLLVWKRRIGPVAGSLLLLIPFMVFVPKIFSTYVIVPAAVMCLLAARRPVYWYVSIAIMALSCLLMLFASYDGDPPVVPVEGIMQAVPIILSGAMVALWLWVAWDVVENRDRLL